MTLANQIMYDVVHVEPVSEGVNTARYRSTGESFAEAKRRITKALEGSEDPFLKVSEILRNSRFLDGLPQPQLTT